MTNGTITAPERSKLTMRAALASIAMSVTLIALKSWAAYQTDSTAMLGSLADSGLDLVASLIILLGVRIAAAPADYDHRFGHGKAEALASLVQVILISLSAIFIGFRAVQRLLSGAQTAHAELGIGVSVAALILTAALIAYQRHVVRRTGSLAIGTDRLHYSSDLLLNGSVIVALGLDQFAGLTGADAVFGLLIALWLLWGAWSASTHALDQLMDKEWPDELRERFLAAARNRWRSSSGHSRSINWSKAWLDARHAPHASHKAISRPKTASAPVRPANWSSPSATMTEPLSSKSEE